MFMEKIFDNVGVDMITSNDSEESMEKFTNSIGGGVSVRGGERFLPSSSKDTNALRFRVHLLRFLEISNGDNGSREGSVAGRPSRQHTQGARADGPRCTVHR